MNLKEYIASGIIESYVMGLATDAERAEFEQLSGQYPELVVERKRFEESLESYAARQAELAPEDVKAKILAAITAIGPEAGLSNTAKFVRFLKKYFAFLFIPVLWTVIAATLCCLPGSMLPNESHFKIPQFDKFVHICLFGGFVFLWNLYEAKRVTDIDRLLRLFFLFYVLGNVFGIGMEYVQKYWIPGRDYDLADMIADMIGAGLAYGLSNLWFAGNSARGAAAPK